MTTSDHETTRAQSFGLAGVFRVTAGCPPEAGLHIDRTFETGRGWTATPEIAIHSGRGLTVRRVPTSPLAGLWKLDDEPGRTVANGSEYDAPGACHGSCRV